MRGKTLAAKEGFVFTNGTDFGKDVYLKKEDDGSGWYEVPQEAVEMAEAADYQAALREFGVEI